MKPMSYLVQINTANGNLVAQNSIWIEFMVCKGDNSSKIKLRKATVALICYMALLWIAWLIEIIKPLNIDLSILKRWADDVARKTRKTNIFSFRVVEKKSMDNNSYQLWHAPLLMLWIRISPWALDHTLLQQELRTWSSGRKGEDQESQRSEQAL